jgi:Class II Aldolase and Adducin N-terminal domain
VQRYELEAQLMEGCRRLADKSFLNLSSDSVSIRVSGSAEMLLATGIQDWRAAGAASLQIRSFTSEWGVSGLHAAVYRQRADAGAVIVCSPTVARLLSKSGGGLPPMFDEQVRHIGLYMGTSLDDEHFSEAAMRRALDRGANAVLLGERLLCLGITYERAIANMEIVEKCARAHVISRAAGMRGGLIPAWVRFIANRRLMKEERRAAVSYLRGQSPAKMNGYE